MEGRYPNGLLLALVSCSDASKTEEFSDWYSHMHVPDVTSPGIFRHAIRFANTDPASEASQYVTTYETTFEDVSTAMPAHREARAKLKMTGDRGTPWMHKGSSANVYKRLGGEFRAAIKPTLGIMLVLTNCKDANGENEFNRWYEDVHVADILDSGAFHTAYRYESLDPESSKSKYLAIYETDDIDPANSREKIRAVSADWRQRGRMSDLLEVTSLFTARRIWPMS